MRFARVVPLALGISFVSTVSGKVFTDIQTVSQFIAQLTSSHDAVSQVTQILNGSNALSIAKLSPRKKAALACQINHAVNDGTYYTSTPPSAGYNDVIDHHWSTTCWLKPLCVIQPSSAADVSKAIKIVTFTGAKFSVRSGGHNPNSGWASNNGGVLIDTVNLNKIALSSDASFASVGPGNRWGAVYSELSKSSKSVVAGRVTNVGVGGFLLGGGLSHFASEYGLAATNVRNYEIVLANSSIVNANIDTNPDLYTALKGGGPNYGVVTQYDINTVDNSQVYYEVILYDPSQNRALLAAVVEYAKAAEKDDKASLVLSMTNDLGLVILLYNSPVKRPNVFSVFYAIPSTQNLLNSTIASWSDAYAAVASLTSIAPAREMIGAVSYEFDNSTLQESYSSFQKLATQAQTGFNGSMAFVIQTFTKSAVQKSALKGGNHLGLKEVTQAWVASTIQYNIASADNTARDTIQAFEDQISSIAQKRGKNLSYRFMNDAGYNQNVLGSYGADNVARLRDVSHAYDSHQVFQELQNGGFLLSKA